MLVGAVGESVYPGLARIAAEEFDKLCRLADRKRGEHERIDQAEDGGVGAGSECEGQESDGSESGTATHEAQGIANVLPRLLERNPRAHPPSPQFCRFPGPRYLVAAMGGCVYHPLRW